MRYTPTVLPVNGLSKRVLAISTAFTIVCSIVLSTISTATVYAGSEETLLHTSETTEVSTSATSADKETVEVVKETKEQIKDSNKAPLKSAVSTLETIDNCEIAASANVHTAELCDEENPKTLREVIDETPEASTLSTALAVLDEYENCNVVSLLSATDTESTITVFIPSNTAFSGLVRAPGSSSAEMTELLSNPDELCELISYHLSPLQLLVADIPTSGTINTFAHDPTLQAKKNASGVFIDQAKITTADITATNGVAHIIDDVLLPQEFGTVHSVKTNTTSPAISGTTGISAELSQDICVTVRIDGVAYTAAVSGATWTIAKGIVTIDPFKSSTLFDVIIRNCSENTDRTINALATTQGELLGITMTRDIVSYQAPQPTPTPTTGEVLGETDTKTPIYAAAYTYSSPGIACSKGACFGDINTETDTSAKDSDGDGVIDSEDPEPNNPDVTGKEDINTNSSEDKTNNKDDNNNSSQAFWWFIGGGGLALLWYLLWQRGGKESL